MIMLIRDLIDKLEEVYNHDLKYVDVMGEPTIHIDVFKEEEGQLFNKLFEYHGISDDIEIVRDPSGIYNILSRIKE